MAVRELDDAANQLQHHAKDGEREPADYDRLARHSRHHGRPPLGWPSARFSNRHEASPTVMTRSASAQRENVHT